MGFGPGFLGWIRMIYSKQIANIWMQGYKSELTEIGREVRQGFPLSPILFNIVIEVLTTRMGFPSPTEKKLGVGLTNARIRAQLSPFVISL